MFGRLLTQYLIYVYFVFTFAEAFFSFVFIRDLYIYKKFRFLRFLLNIFLHKIYEYAKKPSKDGFLFCVYSSFVFADFLSLTYQGRYATANSTVITATMTTILRRKLGGRISRIEGVSSGRAI